MRAPFAIIGCALCVVLTLPGTGRAQREDQPGTTTYRSSAHDDDEDNFDRQRLYLGAGPLWAWQNFDQDNASAVLGGQRTDIDADDSWGAQARVGYRFHPHLAVEMLGQYYGDFKFTAVPAGSTQRVTLGNLAGASGTMNLKVFILRGRVQPYVVGGVGALWIRPEDLAPGTHVTSEHWSFAGRGGLGVDFYIDEHFAFDVEGAYLAPAGALDEFPLTAVAAGVQYHF